MVRMYDLTKDRQYLDIAKTDEAYIRTYWDDTCGGGVWWDIPGKTYKNAISIELYLKLLASLHNRIPGDTFYLARARQEWNWFRNTGMINDGNLVNDGLQTQSGSCASLGGLVELYKATGDRSLLARARKIANAVVTGPDLSPKGILTEPCEIPANGFDGCGNDGPAFKGIFVRNLAELDRAVPGHPYRGYLRAQAASMYAHDRNAQDQYGLSWAGPFDLANIGRQESAVSLLTAVL
jgi:predicted alpha-1,6-mannanase (GH76 family)